MNTAERVKSKILSPGHIAERKIGVEIESFYYLGNDFRGYRSIMVNNIQLWTS